MKFQLRGFTSLLLAAASLVLGVSGIILYLAPRGRVANWTGWTMLGMEKQEWQSVHINLALLVVIVAGLHLYLNWAIFWCYIKTRGTLALSLKLEMLLAVLITATVLSGAVLGLPPFRTVMAFNSQIKDYWDRWASAAPTPHAEELTLEQVAGDLGLSVNDVVNALRTQGIVVEDKTTTLGQVAEKNGRTPSDVYAAVRKQFSEASPRAQRFGPGSRGNADGKVDQETRRGMGPGTGQGRGMGRRVED